MKDPEILNYISFSYIEIPHGLLFSYTYLRSRFFGFPTVVVDYNMKDSGIQYERLGIVVKVTLSVHVPTKPLVYEICNE